MGAGAGPIKISGGTGCQTGGTAVVRAGVGIGAGPTMNSGGTGEYAGRLVAGGVGMNVGGPCEGGAGSAAIGGLDMKTGACGGGDGGGDGLTTPGAGRGTRAGCAGTAAAVFNDRHAVSLLAGQHIQVTCSIAMNSPVHMIAIRLCHNARCECTELYMCSSDATHGTVVQSAP